MDIYVKATEKALMVLAEQQVKLAFQQSQKEVDDLRQRIKEGMVTAKINGKQIGQKKGSTFKTKQGDVVKALIKKYSKYFNPQSNLNDTEIMKLIKDELGSVSPNTYYKYKQQLLDDLD